MLSRGALLCSLLLFAIFASAQVPAFTIEFPGGQCVPAPVVFENTTQNVVSQLWTIEASFGIVTDTNSTAIQSYGSSGAGTWSVTLFVTYANGDTASASQTFVLAPPPVINGIYTTDSVGCVPFETCFYADVTANAPYSFAWNFCDSTTYNNTFPCVTFFDTGCYCATLIVTDLYGCTTDTSFADLVCVTDLNADFSGDVVYALCPPLEVNFSILTPDTSDLFFVSWDFGDSSAVSYMNNGYHEFTEPGCYDVTLIVMNNDGCTDSVFKPCYIQVDGPFAEVTTTVDAQCGPVTACFFIDSTNSINTLFCPGNGNTCIDIGFDTVCVTYDSLGVYNPTLLICDNVGCCYEKQLGPIYVDSVNAAFSVPSSSVCAPAAIQFTNDSYSALGTFFSNWEFGDGNTSDELHPNHVYTDTGCYNVTLIATGLGGCSDTLTLTDAVCVLQGVEANVIPDTALIACNPPYTVCFDASTSIGSFPLAFEWSMGTLDIGPAACYTFTTAGNYPVEAIVTDVTGCADTAIFNVTIATTVVNITASSTIPEVGESIIFSASPPVGSALFGRLRRTPVLFRVSCRLIRTSFNLCRKVFSRFVSMLFIPDAARKIALRLQ